MKKLLLVLSLLLAAVGGRAQKSRTIEGPAFAFRTSEYLGIERIDLTPDSTVLHLKAFYRPNHWIKLSPQWFIRAGADGEELPFVSVNGIGLDQEFYMPESGEQAFTFTFPAIDPATAKIDLIECADATGWNIYDIRLSKTKTRKSVFAKRYAGIKSCTEELTAPVVDDAPAVLTGRIEGYSPRFFKKVKVQFFDPFQEEGRYETEAEVRPDGTFSMQLPVMHPMKVRLLLNGNTCLQPYVEPGKETVLEINLLGAVLKPSFSYFADPARENVVYYGELGRVNNELYRMDPLPAMRIGFPGLDGKAAADKISRLSPGEYKGIVTDSLKVARERIGSAKQLCPRTRQILFNTVWADAAGELLNYQLWIEVAHRAKMDQFDWNAPIPSVEEPDESYYDFLREYPVNDERMLVGFEAVSTLNAICFHLAKKSPATRKTGRGYSYELDHLLAEPATIDFIGSGKGVFYDAVLFGELSRKQINDGNTPEAYRDRFSNPAFWREAVARQRRREALLAEKLKNPEFTVNEIPLAGTSEEALQAIFDKYKGKVVFVDFWETWCSPCRMAMKEAEPVKKELQGRDVVFVYFASGNSPEDTWNKMIPMIPGEHYRLPNDIALHAREHYSISGVPSYLVLDKEGKQVHFQVGFMGADRMKKMLLEQLDK